MISINDVQDVDHWINLACQKLYLACNLGIIKSECFFPVKFPRRPLFKFYFDKVSLI